MPRLSIDLYFASMLNLVSSRSTCTRRAVGAIITDEAGHVLAMGYNGVPSGVDHCTDVPCGGEADKSGDFSRCWAVHAEQNALLQCQRLDLARTVYVSCTPCFTCAKLIANTPIRRVVVTELYQAAKRSLELFTIKSIDHVHLFSEVIPCDPPATAPDRS